MAGPIYKFFRGRVLEGWYQLSEEEQGRLLARLNEALEQAGGKRVIMGDIQWNSEQWMWAGVETFPDLEAVQKYTELLNQLNLFRYIHSESMLGTEWKLF